MADCDQTVVARYWQCPACCVAWIPKCWSTSLARAIVSAHFPSIESRLQRSEYGQGCSAETAACQQRLPWASAPTLPVVAGLRHPVDRFCSAARQCGFPSVSAAISAIHDGHRDWHFAPASLWDTDEASWYRLPDAKHLLAAASGLGEIPRLNAGGEALTASPSERSRIEKMYAADMTLFEAASH